MAEGRSLFQIADYLDPLSRHLPVAHGARGQSARRRAARRARPAARAATHVTAIRTVRRRPCGATAAARDRGSEDLVLHPRRRRARGRRRVVLASRRGETLAIVGESGCGKSVTALSILRLIAVAAGPHRRRRDPLRRPRPARALRARRCATMRGNEISMIFQEPMTSLNPVLTIGRQIAETLIAASAGSSREAAARARDRDAAPGRHSRARARASRSIRTSSPAACASG